MKVLVTGANGFVGQAVVERLGELGQTAQSAVRREGVPGAIPVGAISDCTDWSVALQGCEAVVHLAAHVHQMDLTEGRNAEKFHAVNVEGTLRLARQCIDFGLKRFVFVSTVKVHGEGQKTAYRESDAPAPQEPYALSKWDAEQGLHALAAGTKLEVVILRPPLVYGPGVGANFLRLINAVRRGIPLPLGAVDNRRSLIYVKNLADAITTSLVHPAAAGRTYLVSDGEDVSTTDLVERLADLLGLPPRLFAIPHGVMQFAGRILGKRQEIERLFGSLVVDGGAIRRELGWRPPYSMREGLGATVNWALRQQ
ncbi:MAG: SDR family oxidoreductase [Sterolibacteriaceae bacterium MAG5]|nr:SDR family oxidoreductase [Candidatus Nitricoxidireducens bremensis]